MTENSTVVLEVPKHLLREFLDFVQEIEETGENAQEPAFEWGLKQIRKIIENIEFTTQEKVVLRYPESMAFILTFSEMLQEDDFKDLFYVA